MDSSVGARVRPVYEGASYHGTTASFGKNPAPINGQAALDNSLQITENSLRRVGIDYEANQFVIFDYTGTSGGRPIFHGHVRAWEELRSVDRKILMDWFDVTKKGKIR